MQLTKYPQSCLILEKDDKRILIDPGSFMANKFSAGDLPEFDAIFLTHRHPDHADPDFIRSVLAQKNIPVYGNQDTKELLGELVSNVITPSDVASVGGFDVTVYDMPHCLLPDGSVGPPNNGYVFDGDFLHAGDGVSAEGLTVTNAAIAIAGPDLSLKDAADLIKAIGATKVIPIHYSIFSDDKPAGAIGLIKFGAPGVEIIALDNAETILL
jgi:L-ascorbate metabolism protein UlaG (beta-lactamase superfamily)